MQKEEAVKEPSKETIEEIIQGFKNTNTKNTFYHIVNSKKRIKKENLNE